MTNQDIISLIAGLYMWFNQISDPSVTFQKNDLQKHFSPDFIMELNDKIVVEDYDSLFTHFEKFRNSGYQLKVQLPLQEIVVSEDRKKCVARYNISKVLDNKEVQNIKVIAIWHISEDGRLKRMNEVVYFSEAKR